MSRLNEKASSHTGRRPSASLLLAPAAGVATLLLLVAALPRAPSQVLNTAAFWKQQVLASFKPKAPASGAQETWAQFPRRARPQSKPLQGNALEDAALVPAVRGAVVRLPDAWKVARVARLGQLHPRAAASPKTLCVVLPLQGELRHFLQFWPGRSTSRQLRVTCNYTVCVPAS